MIAATAGRSNCVSRNAAVHCPLSAVCFHSIQTPLPHCQSEAFADADGGRHRHRRTGRVADGAHKTRQKNGRNDNKEMILLILLLLLLLLILLVVGNFARSTSQTQTRRRPFPPFLLFDLRLFSSLFFFFSSLLSALSARAPMRPSIDYLLRVPSVGESTVGCSTAQLQTTAKSNRISQNSAPSPQSDYIRLCSLLWPRI